LVLPPAAVLAVWECHETARISRHPEFSQAQIPDHLALTNDRIDLDFTVTSSRGARHYVGKGREKEDEDNSHPDAPHWLACDLGV
jgi:hypothetical protein